jgi:NitT/TauT family transport system substrate-binding protein
MRRLMTCLVVAALAAGLTAPAATAETKLRLGLLPLALHQLPVMVAKEQGFFRDEGLDVDFTIFKGGSEVAPALINGNIDVAQGVVAHPIKLSEKGLRTRILVLTQATPTFVLAMAKKHADVKDVAQFKGRGFKIAIARRGSDSDMMMRAVLAWKKLDPERDVSLVQIPSYANHIRAVERGDVDGAMILEPFATQGEREGVLVPLVDFTRGQGPVELQRRPWTSLYVTEASYQDRRDVARGLVKAVVRADAFIRDHLDESVAVARKYFPSFDQALLKQVIERTRGAYSPAVTPERFAAENKYLIFGGVITTAQPYDQVVATDMQPLWKGVGD